MKNRNMANLGLWTEKEIEWANDIYLQRGLANVQKISTPWQIVRNGKGKIISAFPVGKSTLDFRGTLKGGQSISFDAKETENEKGLPLANIEPHQIEYIRRAIQMNEVSFIACHLSKLQFRAIIKGDVVLEYWDSWQRNKGKRGFNLIAMQDMIEVKPKNGIVFDYLAGFEVIKGTVF